MKDHPFIPKIYDDHSCQVRRRFENKTQATMASQSVFMRTGKNRAVEACRYCSGYHLADAK